MAAPTTVTSDEVIEAGQRLKTAGKRVTGWTIRKELGGRGDPTRLQAVWLEHDNASGPAVIEQRALPPALTELLGSVRTDMLDALTKCVTGLWLQAERIATDRLDAEIQTARRERDDALADLQEAASDTMRLVAEIEVAQRATKTALGERDRALGRSEAVTEERDRLLADLEATKGVPGKPTGSSRTRPAKPRTPSTEGEAQTPETPSESA